MNTFLALPPSQMKSIYKNYFGTKNREKVDMILDPFQAMIQLALLGHSPTGTKLRIQNNLLSLNFPVIYQGLSRWYNDDKKDDLYYLFHVFRRFNLWFKNNSDYFSANEYNILITHVNKGISNLIKTYENTENTPIVHILNMYRSLLNSNQLNDTLGNVQNKDEEESCESGIEYSQSNIVPNIDIDTIFKHIIQIYPVEIKGIIFNILKLCEKESSLDIKRKYINGLNEILEEINVKIKKWINEKLII
jgi:hypothetical protein